MLATSKCDFGTLSILQVLRRPFTPPMSGYLLQLKKVICFSFYLHSKTSLINFLVSRTELCPGKKKNIQEKAEPCWCSVLHPNFGTFVWPSSFSLHTYALISSFFLSLMHRVLQTCCLAAGKKNIRAYRCYAFISRGDGWVRSDKWALKTKVQQLLSLLIYIQVLNIQRCAVQAQALLQIYPPKLFTNAHMNSRMK